MAVQTTYATEHGEAYAGMPADLQARNTISKLNKSGVVIPFGKGVVSDGEDAAKLPTGASVLAEFNGVAMRELNRDIAGGGTFGAQDLRDFAVVTHGVIWVTTTETVVKDDPVYLRVGATGLGDFSNIVGTGVTLGILIEGAKFVSGADAGDLAKISLGIGG